MLRYSGLCRCRRQREEEGERRVSFCFLKRGEARHTFFFISFFAVALCLASEFTRFSFWTFSSLPRSGCSPFRRFLDQQGSARERECTTSRALALSRLRLLRGGGAGSFGVAVVIAGRTRPPLPSSLSSAPRPRPSPTLALGALFSFSRSVVSPNRSTRRTAHCVGTMAAALSEGEPAGGKNAAEEGGAEGGAGGGASPALAGDGSVGLLHWERQRSVWVSGERAALASSEAEEGGEEKRPQQRNRGGGGARAPVIDPDANYDDLLLTNEPFEVPIPLPEMVDFLVDTWIDDGLY